MAIFIVFAITLTAFVLVIVGMAVGVMMGRRSISGSCGGLANQGGSEAETSCSLCSDPDAACRELGRRMEGEESVVGASTSDNASAGGCSSEAGLREQTACADEGCSKAEMGTCKST